MLEEKNEKNKNRSGTCWKTLHMVQFGTVSVYVYTRRLISSNCFYGFFIIDFDFFMCRFDVFPQNYCNRYFKVWIKIHKNSLKSSNGSPTRIDTISTLVYVFIRRNSVTTTSFCIVIFFVIFFFLQYWRLAWTIL